MSLASPGAQGNPPSALDLFLMSIAPTVNGALSCLIPFLPPTDGETGLDMIDRLNEAFAGRYTVQRELGRGGMATVFLADDLKHARQVAIKVLHPELAAVLGSERFLKEIEIAAGLTHPHILPLHDSGEADGLLYYVMPAVEGHSLRRRLDEVGSRLPADEALRIARQVADALHFAHTRGVVHRDVKPGNIMLSAGHARVSDFGIASTLEAAGEEKLTATGLAIGSPAYMSPEQATGEPVDARTDVYSLGCVLYEMLAGEPPLMGSNARVILSRRLTEKPTPLQELRETVPGSLDRVVMKALSASPEERHQTAADFARALALPRLVRSPATPMETDALVRVERVEPSLPRRRGGSLHRMLTQPLGDYLPANPIRRLLAGVALWSIVVGSIAGLAEGLMTGNWGQVGWAVVIPVVSLTILHVWITRTRDWE